MKIELKDRDINLLDRIGDITEIDYLWDTKDGYIDIDYIWNALSDLEDKYSELDDDYTSYKDYIRDNYKQRTLEETYR